MLSQGIVGRVISLGSQLSLAALLQPEVFGLIALTYTVTSAAGLLTNMGVDDVVLQRGVKLPLWLGPTFWINGLLGLFAGLLVAIAAPFAGALYRAPSLEGLLWFMAAAIPLGAASAAPALVLRSRLRFGFLAASATVEALIQASLTVALAWDGFGAYSFVIPAPIIAAGRLLVWWRAAGVAGSLRPQWRRWKYLFRDTFAHFLTKSILVGISQCDYVVLGFTATRAEVGIYYFGFRLAVQSLWVLAGSISNIMVSVFVQLGASPVQQAEAALKAAKLLCFLIMPIALAQAALAPMLVAAVFGRAWLPSVPIVQLLSIGFGFDAASWIAGALLIARGEFIFGLKLLLIQGPVFLAMVLLGAHAGGGLGVAWAVCAYYVAIQPLHAYIVFRRAGVATWPILQMYLQPLGYAVVAVGLALAIASALAGPRQSWTEAALLLSLSGLSYAAILRRLSPLVWSDIGQRVRQAVRPAVA